MFADWSEMSLDNACIFCHFHMPDFSISGFIFPSFSLYLWVNSALGFLLQRIQSTTQDLVRLCFLLDLFLSWDSRHNEFCVYFFNFKMWQNVYNAL